MIISTISRGSLTAGDESFIGVSGGGFVERIFRILVRALYQTRMASSSITVVKV